MELIEAGIEGLRRAVMKFDLKSDYKFIAYAVWWIRQAMIQAIVEKK
jgi:RNA polymerase primary sigma factor